jgi:hypothetical protein
MNARFRAIVTHRFVEAPVVFVGYGMSRAGDSADISC